MKQYDIIIIGSSVVGLTVACSLASANLSIAIVDKQTQPDLNLDESIDGRVYAITQASKKIFQEIGVWDDIIKRASPYQKMEVWDSEGGGKIHFNCCEIGKENLGHIIEHKVIVAALLHRLHKYSNIIYYPETTFTSLQFTEENVVLEGSLALQAKLVVGADGAESWVRTQSQINLSKRDYHHTALISTVTTEKPHQKVAYQRFMPKGPLAFLPLLDPYQSSIVWSSAPEHIKMLYEMKEDEFQGILTVSLENRLGKIISCSERQYFPLSMRHAKQYVRARIALVGDAAHTIHPLAGQGVNLGILDAYVLAKELRLALIQARDIGALHVLRRYERQRKGHTLGMIALMESFKQLFAQTHPLLSWCRNVGLLLTDQSGPLKRAMMRWAIGENHE